MLHLQAGQRRNEQLKDVRELMRQADQILECLSTLELEVRLTNPHRR